MQKFNLLQTKPGTMEFVLGHSLEQFAESSLRGAWNGRREREAISRYVFGYLIHEVTEDGWLRDPAQITIEFPVPQVRSTEKAKQQVCKDLVIWPLPGMTCWDKHQNPTVSPSAILEWKFNSNDVHQDDVQWLQEFVSKYPECTGFAVTANRPGRNFLLDVTLITATHTEPRWIHIR